MVKACIFRLVFINLTAYKLPGFSYLLMVACRYEKRGSLYSPPVLHLEALALPTVV